MKVQGAVVVSLPSLSVLALASPFKQHSVLGTELLGKMARALSGKLYCVWTELVLSFLSEA